MAEAKTTQRPVPAHLPLRAQARVKKWMDFKSFGFLVNPDRYDTRDIFVHCDQVPIRLGIGQRLLAGEMVTVRYGELPDGRLKAVEIIFPE